MPPSTSEAQEAPPPVGVIDPDPAARAGIHTLLQPIGFLSDGLGTHSLGFHQSSVAERECKAFGYAPDSLSGH